MYKILTLLWLVLITATVVTVALVRTLYQQQVRDRSEQVSLQLTQLLVPYRSIIDTVFANYEIELQKIIDPITELNPEAVSGLKSHPLVNNLVAIDSTNHLVLPSATMVLEPAEINLLRDAVTVLQESTLQTQAESSYGMKAQSSTPVQSKWVVWFHNRSIQLGRTYMLRNQVRLLVILPRGRWMADILAALPDDSSTSLAHPRLNQVAYRLTDATNNTIYQWGSSNVNDVFNSSPMTTASLTLNNPLSYWHLQAAPSDVQADSVSQGPYVATALSAALLLFGFGAVITVSLRSAMLNAMRKVSFVNQVSHELKTPLTNILLFNELMQRDIEQTEDPSSHQALLDRSSTIHTEAKRLQFLIDNVLQYARGTRYEQKLHLRPAIPDQIVERCISRVAYRFADANISVETDLNAAATVKLDEQVLEQIVDNLLSNVEKYANQGRVVKIATSQHDSTLNVVVADHGPGIPKHMRQKVFEPFFRLDDSLETAAGTGIGLANVRTLTRLHGGDCQIIDSEVGAVFSVTLKAPLVQQDGLP